MSVPSGDNRRLDLIVPGLSADRGLPLFYDITIVSPIARNSEAPAGTSNRGGSLLDRAEQENDNTYFKVHRSHLASLQCVSCEVYGRWGRQSAELVPKLAPERARGLPLRIRRGAQLIYQKRWCGILSVALQSAVARTVAVTADQGADLFVAL